MTAAEGQAVFNQFFQCGLTLFMMGMYVGTIYNIIIHKT